MDGTDGLEERSARDRLSQSQYRVGWSPRVLRTPLGFDLAAPFAFFGQDGGRVLAQDGGPGLESSPGLIVMMDDTEAPRNFASRGSNLTTPLGRIAVRNPVTLSRTKDQVHISASLNWFVAEEMRLART